MTVGLTPNQNVPFFWGARAKYDSKFRIELDGFDDWNGESISSSRKERLLAWLHSTGLKLLRQQVKQNWIGVDENRLITINDSGYFLQANPKASGKYLFICVSEV